MKKTTLKASLGLTLLVSLSSADALGNSLVKQAQTIVNQYNQGRACTSFTKTSLEATFDSSSPEYAKRHLLMSHGLVKMQPHKSGTLTWERYTNVPLKESAGKGVWIPDGQVTYYCFGWWKVTAAKPTDKAQPSAGKKLLLATLVLQGAPKWVTTDPKAVVLNESSFRGDPAFWPALNNYDKVIPMSMTKPNQVLIEVPK